MKKQILLLALLFVSAITFAQSQTFGEELSDTKAEKATTLAKSMDGKETMQVKLQGEINEVCQMKGCWMTVDAGKDTEIRVTFKDYGFFVPKDAAGKTAVFEGEAKFETLDVKTLKHYAEDAGKSQEEIDAITEPETRLTFVATGVEIK
jgi:uncharacterized protein YdeI (BOF family)